MALKLYEVRINTVAYVLAKSEREARGFERDIMRNEPFNVAAKRVPRGAILAWPDGCCVYGAEDNMTLGDAVAKYIEVDP